MPELPEVETIRRGLDRRLRGARITRVEIREPRLRRVIDEDALRALVGRRIEGIARRGKYLLADVGGGMVWLMHLGMSGRLLLLPSDAPAGEHEHVRIEFDLPIKGRDEGRSRWSRTAPAKRPTKPAAFPGGRSRWSRLAPGEQPTKLALCYRDPRRFGWMRIAPAEALGELDGLGPEPLNGRLRAETLRARLRGTRRDVKAALLDQRVLAGIGNIYANEILFHAGVRPTRRCNRLRCADLDAIVRATRSVLGDAVLRRGTSFSDYFDSDGTPGSFQEVLAVFDRAGQPCRRCGGTVQRRRHGGRSSFYCPGCQR
ncbi:MAG TPA: Fpg/Nei family DNA glycosylase [Candidatus Binatia bacterium]|nr:Fpg/Nei family DNA glycosylase [Candidatus Binatia bacterium]